MVTDGMLEIESDLLRRCSDSDNEMSALSLIFEFDAETVTAVVTVDEIELLGEYDSVADGLLEEMFKVDE